MGVFRYTAAAAALPLTVLLRLGQRFATGREAVLDMVVDHQPDLRERALLLERLRRAAHDPLVTAVLLRLRSPPAGWASCEDLRDAIQVVRAAGRPVYAWLEAPGNAVTWLAAACDHVFLVPTGEVGLVGVGVELTFFGAALGRLGVTPDFEAAGAYKSFGETFTRSYPSPQNREAVSELVNDLHDQLISGIAAGRKLTPEAVNAALEQAPLSGQDAVDAGLVDELLYEDQLEGWLRSRHGNRARLVPFARWAWRDQWVDWVSRWGRPGATLAVLHLQGPIVLEDSRSTAIAARTVVPILKRLREDDQVGAVVLHIDSPGGSALASDLIWREVDELRRHKPVVASFEDVSASGGFYLSAPANAIFVRTATLTGSIGVFGGKLVVAEGARRVGVHTSEILGARNANLYSPSRRFTDDQRQRFRASLQRFYDGFVGRVAEGRGALVEAIEPHCRGRVWTGEAARVRGLVDQVGGLEAAAERALALAGLSGRPHVRKDYVGHHEPLLARLAQGVVRQVVPSQATHAVRAVAAFWASGGAMVEVALSHPGQPLAMLPFEVKVR